MPAVAVIGAQWGDEGKGKIVDLLARQSDVVMRYSGGDNAGHTVDNSYGLFKLHLVPSGIFSGAVCLMGNGMVINPAVLLNEIDDLKNKGIDCDKLYISDRAHAIMPYHTLVDRLEEESLGKDAVGTTRKGIGPAYTDKMGRIGIRMGDLIDKSIFASRLKHVLAIKNRLLTGVYGCNALSFDQIYDEYSEYAARLKPYIRDTSSMLDRALRNDQKILMEGAQGTLLDPDFGTYPYVTSSSPGSAGSCIGSGLAPNRLKGIIGVFKAYCTRVGNGPMPTELNDQTGECIRKLGNEYGTTTGRARRCGWFDAVAARFSQNINGFTGLAITRLDILDTLPKLKICTAYRIDGKENTDFPASVESLEKCIPVYEELPGWQCPTSDTRNYKDLPLEARQYIARIEQLTGCSASLISIGQHIDQTIELKPPF